MSGHSKWSTIKRQKGLTDAKRSTTFTKLSATLTLAAREGGGDPSTNFKLRLAVEKARHANMPKDNIDRAIKRGTGELGGAVFEQVVYEAYAPGGAALLIDVTTDNRNRAVASIKSILTKHNAKLAESGAVSYLFQPRGVMLLAGGDSETIESAILESAAEDYEPNQDDSYSVYTAPKDTMAVAKSFSDQGLQVTAAELSMEALSNIEITDEKTVTTLLSLIEQLEELDDVTAVYANFNLPETTG